MGRNFRLTHYIPHSFNVDEESSALSYRPESGLNMDVSIALCTWNRAAVLDQTLRSFRALEVPSQVSWELVVVNNSSTDHTDEVIAQHQQWLPIRRLYEAKGGKSNAANLAIASIESDLTLWTDDDVQVAPDWLRSYVEAAERYSDAVFFGGPIKPLFSKPMPRWMTVGWRHVRCVYGELDFGTESQLITPLTLPYGANFAIRTDLQRHLTFNPALGRNQESRIAGEETELFTRLLRTGHQGRYVPQAMIHHCLTEQQMTIEHARNYFIGIGRTKIAMRLLNEPDFRVTQTLCLQKQWRAQWLQTGFQLRRSTGLASLWVKYLRASSLAWGEFAECQKVLAEQEQPAPRLKPAKRSAASTEPVGSSSIGHQVQSTIST